VPVTRLRGDPSTGDTVSVERSAAGGPVWSFVRRGRTVGRWRVGGMDPVPWQRPGERLWVVGAPHALRAGPEAPVWIDVHRAGYPNLFYVAVWSGRGGYLGTLVLVWQT
jgi:hypothetical protein